MSRRIVGQCGTADFKDIESMASFLQGGMLPRALTKHEKDTVQVIRWFQLCGVPFNVLLKVKKVLIWGMPEGSDRNLVFEYELLDPRDYQTRQILVNMKPEDKKRK